METPVQKLRRYFKNNPPKYGNEDCLLDFLYWHYFEYNPINNCTIKEQFSHFREILKVLAEEDFNKLFTLVVDICIEHELLAFKEGLRLGVALVEDLSCKT